MTTINVIMQQETIDQLEHEKQFLLAVLRDIEDMCNRGNELDTQMISVGIKQIRGQVESGEIHRRNITPGLVRE